MKKAKILFILVLVILLLGLGYQVYAKYVMTKSIQIPFTTSWPTQVSITTTKNDAQTATINATATDNGAGIKKYDFYINNELKETVTTSDLTASYSFDYALNFGTTYDTYVVVTDNNNATGKSNTSQIIDYTINTKEDMELFRDSVNNGNTYEGETIIQTASIDLKGSETNQWTPIGNYGVDTSLSFNGTFDGNNYTISNLYINSETGYQGLFGMVRGATIKNVTVEGQITSTGNRVAGISGYVSGSNNVIESCTNKATINGNGEVAGIVGASGYSGIISKCCNLGTVTGGANSTYVGGIIGSHTMASSLTIEYCYNAGEISANSSMSSANGGVGGIAGHIMEGCSVNNCYNTASISRTYSGDTYTTRAAGIVAAQREKSSIINCYNTGNISAINTASSSNIIAAGITATAAVSADAAVTIENCYYLDGSAEYAVYMQNTSQYKTIINNSVSTSDSSLYPESLDGIIENRNETLFKGAVNSTTSVTYLLNNKGTANIWTRGAGYPILWWQTDGYVLADVVSVGDYVNYDASSNGTYTFTSSDCLAGTSISATISTEDNFNSDAVAQWRVLSVDKANGTVELMSTEPTQQSLTLVGINGFINSETVLNNIGAIYGHGKGATGGRCITIEDIEQYSSYDKTKFGYGNYIYGDTKTYTGGNFVEEIKDSEGNVNGYGTTVTSSATLTLTYYGYEAKSYFTDTTIYNMIFKNSTNTNNNKPNYWMSSRCSGLYENYGTFMVRVIHGGSIYGHQVYDSTPRVWIYQNRICFNSSTIRK